MTRRRPSEGSDRADFLDRISLPLRGLASEGANEIVGQALRALPGVATVTVRMVEQIVLVTYDPAVISGEAIRERLHTVGLVHPERDAGAHGPEGAPPTETSPAGDGEPGRTS